jgi:AbrB family looped-hinge helix DNA binding protein
MHKQTANAGASFDPGFHGCAPFILIRFSELTCSFSPVIAFIDDSEHGGLMDRAVVTVQGRIVIPSKLRRKFGIKKGTQVYVYERDGEIAIKPIPDDYIRSMAGMAGTKGKLLKALMEEKVKQRRRRNNGKLNWSLGIRNLDKSKET